MNSPPDPAADPTRPEFYGEGYYRTRLHDGHWFKDSRAKHRLRWEAVTSLLDPSASDVVLDLGCANGDHALALRQLVAEVIGVDFSESAIKLANERTTQDSGVRFIRLDVTSMPAIASTSIDKAVAIDLLEHLNDEQVAGMLEEVWRVLKPGGRFVFYTPCASHYVERMKADGRILKQLPGHIAVRDGAHYRRLFSTRTWLNPAISHLPSSYPMFGIIDRFMMRMPVFGHLFRFRIVGALTKP